MSFCNGCENLVSLVWLAKKEGLEKGKIFYDCDDFSNDFYIGAFDAFEEIPKPPWCPKLIIPEEKGMYLRKMIDPSGDSMVRSAIESGVKFIKNVRKECENK